MTCKKCGLELKRSDKFCPRCGEIAPKQKTSTTKKVVVVLASFIAVVAVCGVISVVLNNSNSSPKVYKNTSRSFDGNYNGNYKSNVKKNLNTSEAETKAEKGIITGQVLDDLGNPIENAEVCAIVVREAETKDNAENVSDTSGNDSEIKTKTDKEGKYSIECLVGEYKIQITADGYDGFISEKYVTVSTGKTVSIEKISLKSKNSEFDSLITNVIDNEAKWTSNIDKENQYLYNNSDAVSGNEYIWFQDMDMDGTVEFLAMSKCDIFNGDGSSYWRYYTAWKCDSDFSDYKMINLNGEDVVGTERVAQDTPDSISFNYSLWQKKDGTFVYLMSTLLQSKESDLFYLKLDKSSTQNYKLISVYDDQYMINYRDNGDGSLLPDTVSSNDAVNYYNDYFDGMVGYKTNVKMIKLSDYQNKTEDEKRKLLEESAKAWSYSKDENAVSPLKSTIDGIPKENINESSDYKQLYKNKLEELSNDPNFLRVKFSLCDMNKDGVPELAVETGACEGDYEISFYTVKNGSALKVGDGFSGWHTGFCFDLDKNLFCTHSTYAGDEAFVDIEWFTFDGNNVNSQRENFTEDYVEANINYFKCDVMYWDKQDFTDQWSYSYYTNNDVLVNSGEGKDYSLIDNYK